MQHPATKKGTTRKTKTLVALIAATVIAAIATGSASAVSIPSTLAWSARITTPTCVTPARMDSLSDEPMKYGVSTLGLTDMYSRHVWLLDSICRNLSGWQTSTATTVKPQQIEALVTLFHEAAHAHGVRSERAAECAGVKGALRTVATRYPWLNSLARKWFLHDDEQYRPAAYKLNGTCAVA